MNLNFRSVPPSSNKASGVPVSLDKELKSRELHDADGSLSGALGQQINVRCWSCLVSITSLNPFCEQSLQAQLDATKSAYRESQSEVELLKLQLISSRRSDWLNDISRTSGSVTTRDLIRRDKKLFKMKMYKVDVLDPGQARELVKDVCARLNIPSLDEIESGLDKIEAVVRLIPQMEQVCFSHSPYLNLRANPDLKKLVCSPSGPHCSSLQVSVHRRCGSWERVSDSTQTSLSLGNAWDMGERLRRIGRFEGTQCLSC